MFYALGWWGAAESPPKNRFPYFESKRSYSFNESDYDILGTKVWWLSGQVRWTSRYLSTRVNKHRSKWLLARDSSVIASHCIENWRCFNFNKPKILVIESKLKKQLFLEMVYINGEQLLIIYLRFTLICPILRSTIPFQKFLNLVINIIINKIIK